MGVGSAVRGAARLRVLLGLAVLLGDDLAFVVVAAVPRGEQHHPPRRPIDDRRRVAAGVGTVVPHHLRLAPGRSAVGRTAKQEIDVAAVTTPALASFGATSGVEFRAELGDEFGAEFASFEKYSV